MGHVYSAPFKYEKLQAPVGGAKLQWGTHTAPTGLGIGSISSYKHFASTALWSAVRPRIAFIIKTPLDDGSRMTNDGESIE